MGIVNSLHFVDIYREQMSIMTSSIIGQQSKCTLLLRHTKITRNQKGERETARGQGIGITKSFDSKTLGELERSNLLSTEQKIELG